MVKEYVALENIDVYRVGDKVPAEKAEVWNQMYEKPPCKFVGEIKEPAPNPLDVNKDGKVDAKDVKIVSDASKKKK